VVLKEKGKPGVSRWDARTPACFQEKKMRRTLERFRL